MNQPPRLRVGVIGVGRVGSVLAAALQQAQHPVVAAHAVSQSSLNRAAVLLPATDLVSIDDVVKAAQLLLISVPDDVLPGLVAGIASTVGFQSHQLIAHTSGRHGIGVLEPARARGAIVMALHPAMTFTGSPTDRVRLTSCPFGVTAEPEGRAAAEALVIEMGGDPWWVEETDRPKYHAALSHASNNLNTVIAQSRNLLGEIGFADSGAFLTPLVMASVENALALGTQTLTGPISRGDVETLRAHIETLRGSNTFESYRALALATIELAVAANRITESQAQPLRDVCK